MGANGYRRCIYNVFDSYTNSTKFRLELQCALDSIQVHEFSSSDTIVDLDTTMYLHWISLGNRLSVYRFVTYVPIWLYRRPCGESANGVDSVLFSIVAGFCRQVGSSQLPLWVR